MYQQPQNFGGYQNFGGQSSQNFAQEDLDFTDSTQFKNVPDFSEFRDESLRKVSEQKPNLKKPEIQKIPEQKPKVQEKVKEPVSNFD